MRVRTLCRAENVIENGDVGTYLETNGGQPPCRCRWERYGAHFVSVPCTLLTPGPGGTYWVQWHDVEIIGDALPQHTDTDVPARLARAEEGVPPVAAAIDPSALAQLVGFGFAEADVQAALTATGGDMNAAANILMG